MPNHPLTSRPDVKKIGHPDANTVFYSDPTLKRDPDARGIRLAVGVNRKVWHITRRMEGKVRTIRLGEWPTIPDIFAARDVATEKLQAVAARTDARSTGINTLRDALESHIEKSNASLRTIEGYRAQVAHNMADLFERPIETITLPDLERILRPHKVGTQKHLAQIIRTAFRRAAIIRRCYNVAQDLKVDTTKHVPDNRVGFSADERWPALDLINSKKQTNQFIGTAYEVMLFTGIRAGNVISLRWSDLDLTAGTLTIAKLKNGRSQAFPLCDRLVTSLTALTRISDWVFPQHDVAKHIYHPDRLSNESAYLRPHDCRRLFTTAARRAELPAYIIDQLRGDVAKDVQTIYDQGSISRKHANLVAAQIEVECRLVPDLRVVS